MSELCEACGQPVERQGMRGVSIHDPDSDTLLDTRKWLVRIGNTYRTLRLRVARGRLERKE